MIQFLKSYVWLIMIGILIFSGAVYLGKQKTAASQDDGEVTYEYSDARIGDIAVEVSGVGQLQASQQVDLKAVAAGDAIDVTQVHVSNNQAVTEGQLLITLDSRDAENRVSDAQLSLQSELIKQKQIIDLNDNETTEDKRVRQLEEITVQQRISALTQAQESLDDYQIYAPFDGVITDLSISSGDSISRTDVIASVITDENIVVVTLNEVDALSVEEGNAVTLTFDALLGAEVTGQVSRVDTIGIADQGVVGYGVEIAINTYDTSEISLRPGMSVNAEITAQSTDDVLIVPNSAVKGSSKEKYVEQMDGGQVVKKIVETGVSNTFYTEISSGLSVGDTVITNTIQPQTATEEGESGGGILSNFSIPGTGGGGPGR